MNSPRISSARTGFWLVVGLVLLTTLRAFGQAPAFTDRPLTKLVLAGQSVTISLGATGAAPLAFQWERNGQILPGLSGPTLNLPAATLTDDGDYRVKVSNASGEASTLFSLHVAAPNATLVQWGASGALALPPNVTGPVAAVVGNSFDFTLKPDGTVVFFDATFVSQGAAVPSGLGSVVAIATNGTNALALKADGTVVNWSMSNLISAPAPPVGLNNVVAIAAGGVHSLALKSDGTVVGWGNNQFGKITIPASAVPYVAVAASNDHSSALRADGTVAVWGSNEFGLSDVPPGLSDVVRLVEGGDHIAALRRDGTVVTWGGTPGRNDVPAGLAGVVALSAGGAQTLAIRPDGTFVAFGGSSFAVPSALGPVVTAVAGVDKNYALLIAPDPWVPVPPSSRFVPAGMNATFSATATGTAPLTYRWRRNGVDLADGSSIAGSATTTLTLTNVQPAAAGEYTLAVSNAAGTSVSAPATLTVGVPPTISGQPVSQTLAAGTAAAFTISANGINPLAYQWKFNGNNLSDVAGISGSTSATLTITNLQEDNAGAYSVSVTDAGGATLSAAATLTVTGPPVTPLIRQQSGTVFSQSAAPVTLSVTAASTMSLSYQWYEGATGDVSRPLAGETNATTSVPVSDLSRAYWVRLTNPAGAVDSASIPVIPWVARNSGLVASGNSNDLIGASYANGRFFVSGNGGGASSVDGVTWTTFIKPGSKVAYGGGVYVTCGGSTSGQIYSSFDGASWVPRTSGQTNIVARVIFNGTLFVAVGDSGQISTSSDGVAWVLRPSGTTSGFADVTTGNGLHVAVGQSGAVATSGDGINWTSLPPITTRPLLAVAYGCGRFVALAGQGLNTAGYELWTSENGTAWTQRTMPTLPGGTVVPAAGGNDVAFGGGVFVVAVGKHLLNSTDGLAWSVVPNFFPLQTSHGNSLAYGNGRFLAAGQAATLLQSLPFAYAARISAVTTSQFVVPGQSTTLTLTGEGPNLSYQWYRGTSGDVSQPIPGATNAQLQTGALTQAQSFWVRVTNSDGVVDSGTITVSMATAPTLTTNTAREIEVEAGQPVSFGILAGGVPAPTLQWYRGTRGDTSNPIIGATASTLTLNASTAVERFWARATNMAGSVDSDAFRYTPWIATRGGRSITNVRQLGDTLFAVGGSGIFTSADGRAWVTRATINNSNLRDIAENAGLYVAVGERGFFTSTDLTTWTQRNLPTTPDYTGALSIACGNGKIVAVGVGHYTSTDGINWTPFTMPAGIQLESVVFDGSRFVATGQSFEFNNPARQHVGVIFSSADGLSWTRVAQQTLPETAANAATDLDRLVFAGGKYLATSNTASCLLVSTDASAWTRYDLGLVEGSRLRTSAYVAGFYVVGTDGNGYLVSKDANIWSPMIGPSGMSGRSLLATTNGVLAVGQTGTTFISADVANWTQLSGVPATLSSTTYGLGKFLSTGSDPTANLYVSEDGSNWRVQRPDLNSQGGGKIAYHAGLFYLTGDQPGVYYRSIDGFLWDQVRSDSSATYQGIVSAGSFVFLLDASTKDIAFGQGRYVAVGQGIVTSTNGQNWTSATSVPSGSFNAVAYGNGQFVAVGTAGSSSLIATSTDGSSWTQRVAPTVSAGYNDIVFSGDRFLVASTTGLIYSLDGISWQFAPDLGNQVLNLTLGAGYVVGTGGASAAWRRAPDGLAVAINALTLAQEIDTGGSVTLTVAATGTGLTYQWYRGNAGDASSPIAGATSATLITPPASSNQRYWVRVTGDVGQAESTAILVALRGPPSIVIHPFSAEVLSGTQSVTLSVVAESPRPISYQWYYGTSGSTVFPISGATGPQLLVPSLSNRTSYWVRVTNEHGSTNSLSAVVTPWVAGQFATGSPAFLTTGGIAYGNGRFLIVGASEGTGLPGAVQTSVDGETWTMSSAPALGSVAFGAGRFVATSRTPSARIYQSSDGSAWTPIDLPSGAARFTAVFFVGDRFVAVSDTGLVATSSDGTSWAEVQVGTQRLYGAASGSGVYALCGAGGVLFKSIDGSAWSAVTSPTSLDLVTIAFGAGKFIALASDSSAFSSTDAATWAAASIFTHDYLFDMVAVHALTFADSRFFGGTKPLAGSGFSSADGVFWGQGLAQLARAASGDGKVVGTNETITVTLTAGGANVGGSGGGAFFRALPAAPLPQITLQPLSQSFDYGSAVTLAVSAGGSGPFSYQWFKNGAPISGATSSSLQLTGMTAASAGSYTVTVASPAGSVSSSPAIIAINPLSERGLLYGATLAGAGPTASLQVAFTIEGTASKQMLIRAVGPTLGSFSIPGFMADPQLVVTNGSNVVASNTDWELAVNAAQIASVTTQIGAYPLSAGSKDAAVLATLAPGTYRLFLEDGASSGGTISIEVYEVDAQPRLVYFVSRGNISAASPSLVLGFKVTGPTAGRSYLIRALGPALGSPGAMADPQLRIYSGNTVIASNDNWGGASDASTAAVAVGATPLNLLSKDAALNFVPPAAGAFTAEVTGVAGGVGSALLEIFEVDERRTAAAPVAIVSLPESLAVDAGQAATLGVVAVGPPPLSFRWSRNGTPINGATSPVLAIPSAQVSDAGSYSVKVSANGSEVTAQSTLTVNPANNAAHAVVGGRYSAGAVVTITNTLYYVGTPTSLVWSAQIPASWTFDSDGGSAGDVKPAANATGTLNWTWNTPPPSPVTFTYSLKVPGSEFGDKSITATATINADTEVQVSAQPGILPVPQLLWHSGDTNHDFRLSLTELLRIIELYNTRNGTVRTGAYVVDPGNLEDGFATDPTRASSTATTLARYHSADSNHDAKLSLTELLRVIELYNYRSGTVRTGQYRIEQGSEDGFAAGP